MSQQGFTIVSIVTADILQVIQEMGDIEYLAKKEFDVKRVDADTSLLTLSNNNTETDLVTVTAAGGKDMYLGEASIGGQASIAGGALGGVTYRLKANAVEIDRFRIDEPAQDEEWTYTFLTKSVKVAASQIIKITAQNDNAGANRISTSQGKLILWEEDSGTDPTILASSITVDATISGAATDIAFIRDRVNEGNWIEVTGAINAVTNTISFVPASGKTFYFHRAKIVISGSTNPATVTGGLNTTNSVINRVQAEIKVDGVTKDFTNLGMNSFARSAGGASNSHTSAYGDTGDGRFDVEGLFLVGDGIKTVVIENTVDAGSATATFSGWIEDT